MKLDLHVGDRVEGYDVVAIDWHSVVLQGADKLCRVEFLADGAVGVVQSRK